MKWNILVGSLVLGLGLSTQSFGFELLDRMLGINGSGCASSCCDTKGCTDAGCAAKCGADTGCTAAATCGCDNGCHKSRCRSRGRRCCHNGCTSNGCAAKCGADYGCAAAASCGCDNGCKKSCRRGCLLDRIFVCRKSCCNSGCSSCEAKCGAEVGCGCGAPAAALESDGDMPPAPVVDPSAFLPSQRRVIHASTLVR